VGKPTDVPWAEVADLVLKALFRTEECPDSTETGRGCRYCERNEVMSALAEAGVLERP
jgi:hypothetical protein